MAKDPPKKKPSQNGRVELYRGKRLAARQRHMLRIDRPKLGPGQTMHLVADTAQVVEWQVEPWTDNKSVEHEGIRVITSGPVSCIAAIVTGGPARG